MSITPKNWGEFQHYKDRKPAWIKLHHALLDDYTFACLPVASRALAPCLWLLASEYEGGEITAPLEEISFRLRMPQAELCEALHPLIESGFFIISNDISKCLHAASNTLAEPEHVAIPERERETEIQVEKEVEKNSRSLRSRASDVSRETISDDWPPDYREQFWAKYPRRIGRKAALRALDAVRKRGEVSFEKLVAAVARIPCGEPRFIPHPTTWLNQGRWDDDPAAQGGPNGFGGSRPLQDDSRSLSRAADRLIEQAERGAFTFGPRPSLLPESGSDPVRLLSKG